MARPPRHRIELSDDERAALERVARAEKLPIQDVQRARVVLYAAEGVPETRDSSIDRTGLDSCSSMRCGSELGEDVLFDDSGQRR